ncbi:hypothetical protein DFS33DRAFT_1324041 [Desarmillaria ectypa]|nr:hypothetical protein DFS33DRAFT_1324041 [Desarmillaria ectypa]
MFFLVLFHDDCFEDQQTRFSTCTGNWSLLNNCQPRLFLHLQTEHEAPPPDYEEFPPSTTEPDVMLFDTKASNYVNIQRHMNSIEESFYIDPNLRLPQALLPSLRAGEMEDTRRNLSIDMTMGTINVDVTIIYKEVFPQSPETKRRVILVVKNKLGPTNMRLVRSQCLHHYPLELNFND